MRSKETNPEMYARRMAKQYPQCWREIEMLRQGRGKDLPDWPDWCYCPMAGSMAVVTRGSANLPNLSEMPAVAALAALAAWRQTKGVYRFDEDLLDHLWETPVRGEIPTEVLYRLPEWCIYVDTQGQNRPMHGFFVHLEWDANTQRQELRLLVDLDGDTTNSIPIHLGSGDVAAGIKAMESEARRQLARLPQYDTAAAHQYLDVLSQNTRDIEPLVSLALYICSQNADISQRDASSKKGRRKQTKKQTAAQAATTWDVGLRIGARLRQASAHGESTQPAGGTHASPRAHVRRAHWHTYWTGPKDNQKPVLRWLSPILVGAQDDLVATVHDV